jgi:hypothetical protein
VKIKIEIIIALTNSISIAEVLISLESLFVLAKTIIWGTTDAGLDCVDGPV